VGGEHFRFSYRRWTVSANSKIGLDDYLCLYSVRDLLALPRERIETEPDLHALIEELFCESDTEQIERVLMLAANVDNPIETERTVKEIANRTGLRFSLLRERVGFHRIQGSAAVRNKQEPVPEVEQEEALRLLRRRDLLQQFLHDTEVPLMMTPLQRVQACKQGNEHIRPLGDSSEGRKDLSDMSPLAVDEHGAARLLAVSVPALRRWRREQRGPRFARLGRCIRYRVDDLNQFLSENTRL